MLSRVNAVFVANLGDAVYGTAKPVTKEKLTVELSVVKSCRGLRGEVGADLRLLALEEIDGESHYLVF
jgi:hypothetical protein